MRIPHSRIEVDDFRREGAELYVLTHYHSDLRQGLKSVRDSIVILPTGYTEDRGEGVNFFFVPYSEHNSTAELNAFLDKVDAREVVDINERL